MMENIDMKINENKMRNQKFLDEFEAWLNGKKLTGKTIRNHLGNVDLFLNDYLNYYELVSMENGIDYVVFFLEDWFIRKCTWASKTSIKETAASIKKFYQCMSESSYVSEKDYKSLCSDLKERMDDILESLEDYDNDTYFDIF